jgi:non-homologous end joining protein Ku
MARAVWSGVISFGLVSVPVGLFTATEEHEPSFHQFAQGGADRIRYKRVNERTGLPRVQLTRWVWSIRPRLRADGGVVRTLWA